MKTLDKDGLVWHTCRECKKSFECLYLDELCGDCYKQPILLVRGPGFEVYSNYGSSNTSRTVFNVILDDNETTTKQVTLEYLVRGWLKAKKEDKSF